MKCVENRDVVKCKILRILIIPLIIPLILLDYYWFNRKELLQKVHDKYHKEGGKEKAKKYYQENKEKIKKREREKCKSMPEEKKDKVKERSLKRYYRLKNKL